jgi:tetratricopeptide (TPR) repeat protein
MVLVGIGCGVFWHVRRNTGDRLLGRAYLALQAAKPDKALDLATSYVAKYPDDWRGYLAQARVYFQQGRFEEARGPLAEAAKRKPDEVAVVLAQAETHSLSAMKSLQPADAARKPAVLQNATAELEKANEVLLAFNAPDGPGALSLQRDIALNYMRMGRVRRAQAAILEEEAKKDDASHNLDLAGKKREKGKFEEAQASKLLSQAAQVLLAVVQKDPSLEGPAETLVGLCIETGDRASLASARKAIDGAAKPPPIAAMMLAMDDLQSSATRKSDGGKKVKGIAEQLDKLLAANPSNARIKLARAEVAILSADASMAARLADEVIKGDPQNPNARLLRARAMLQHAKILRSHGRGVTQEKVKTQEEQARAEEQQAEKALFALKSDFSRWYLAQYWYAQAAEAVGRGELAREAMRTVVMLRPDHAEARRMFARLLLQQGFYEQAFADAGPFYQANPADPEALRTYVEAAWGTDQRDMARAALRKAWKDKSWKEGYASGPVMLMAVADGFRMIGDVVEAGEVMDQLLKQAGEDRPTTTEQILSVANAMLLKERSPEAEKILNDEIAKHPENPAVCFALAEMYKATDRGLQAVEMYRKAVAQSDREPKYRLALARILLGMGDLDEAEDVLSAVLSVDVEAELLRLQIMMIRGQPIDAKAQAILQRPDAGKRFRVPLAMIYLAIGNPQECEKICQAGLKANANDVDFYPPLARAYQAMGRTDECIKTWKDAIKAQPQNVPAYQQVAALLLGKAVLEDATSRPAGATPQPAEGVRMSREEAGEAITKAHADMKEIPGARQELVDLVVAELYAQVGLPIRAAEFFARAVDNPATPQAAKYRAQLLRASALARGGKPDDALRDLDRLIASNQGLAKIRAMYAKAGLLAAGKRLPEAEAVLTALCKEAGSGRDPRSLRLAAGLQVQIGRVDQALATCDTVQQLLPSDSRSYLLRADVLTAARKTEQVPDLYEKAIELQPGDFRLYEALANVLDAQDKPSAALQALARTEGLSQAALPIRLFQQGTLMARWGLQAEAVRKFTSLAELQYGSDPRLQLALAQALSRMGRKDQAKAALAKISEYAQEYLAGQLMLADLTDGADAKLVVIRNLGKKKPGNESVLDREMSVLVQSGRAAEAVQAFDAYWASGKVRRALPASAAPLAVTAAVRAGDLAKARQICQALEAGAGSPQWRVASALLSMDDDPAKTTKGLGVPSKASVFPAMLGLCLAKRAGDKEAVSQWCARLDKLEADLERLQPARSIPAGQRFLCGLLAGDILMAKGALAKLGSGPVGPAGQELQSYAAGGGKPDEEIIKLLKASLAREVGLPELARAWGTEVLKARPACQWAALEIYFTGPQLAELKAALDVLRPDDCDLAKILRADLLSRQKQPKQAAEIYAALARRGEKVDPDYLERQAMALEAAGEPAEALALYRKVLEMNASPVAANNAACLVLRLTPNDKAKLAEASGWMDAALKAMPMPYLQDTAGWIAHLQGEDAKALSLLRRAVKGLPDSPDVHYHLGQVEAGKGDPTLAQWHLTAAVDLGNHLKASGEPISETTAAAVELAKQALASIKKPG